MSNQLVVDTFRSIHVDKMVLTHGITMVWNAHTQPPGRMAQLSGGKAHPLIEILQKGAGCYRGDHPAVVCQKTLFKERWCHMKNQSRELTEEFSSGMTFCQVLAIMWSLLTVN